MAETTDVFDLVLDVSANTDSFVKQMQKAAKDADLNFDIKPMVRSFVREQKKLGEVLTKTVTSAATAGFAKVDIKKMEAKLRPITEDITRTQRALLKAQAEARQKGMNEERRETILNERLKLAGLQKRLQEEEKAVESNIKRQMDAQKEAARLMKRTTADMAKSIGDASEQLGKSVQTALSQIRSGDVSGMLGSIGKGASSAGASMQKRAAAAQVAGQGGKMMAMMGRLGGMLSKLGPYIAALAAVAAGLAAVVAVAGQADSAMKDLNRAMLSGGITANDLANEYGRLGTVVDDIRSTFTEAFTFNRIWGTTAKDHLEILGAYAAAGLTMKEMARGASEAGQEMDELKRHTVAALTYSKLLGMSTQEISTNMATYMEELGMTLDGVQNRFAAISLVAKESGFSTKRFFNMVLQATSGMSMYNVRLEEAAGLLINLGNILGEQVGGDFLQSLTKGFKDEGTQQRVQKTLTTGLGYSIGVLQKDAARSADEFTRKLGELGETNKAAVDAALAGVGAAGLSGQDLAKKLAGLSGTQQTKLLSEVRAADPGMARMLSSLMRSSSAFKGGLGGAQAARGDAGAGASLLLRLSEMRGVTGKRIDQIDRTDITQMMAANQITGAQGQEFLKLYETGRAFSGDLLRLQDMRKEILAGGDLSAINEQAQALGVTFDEAGNMFKAIMGPGGEFQEAGEQIGMNFEDYVMALGDRSMLDTETKVAEDIALAQEIAANTTDMSKILEQGVEALLSRIYDSVSYISRILGGRGLSDNQRQIQEKAVGKAEQAIAATRKGLMGAEQEEAALRRKAAATDDPDKKASLLRQADSVKGRKDKLARTLKGQEMIAREMGRMQGGFSDEASLVKAASSKKEADLIALMDPETKKAYIEGKTAGEKADDLARRVGGDRIGGMSRGLSVADAREASSLRATANAAPSLLGSLGISMTPEDIKQADDQRSKDEIKANDTALEKQTKEYRKIIEDQDKKEQARAVMGVLQQYMSGSTPDALQTMADRLVLGQNPRAVSEALQGNEDFRSALGATGLPLGPMANDFVMHIGATGKVKYAQRVHPGDETVAMSARQGGAMSQASGSKGGVTIIQHNYTDMESIKKGWRALRNAKAL